MIKPQNRPRDAHSQAEKGSGRGASQRTAWTAPWRAALPTIRRRLPSTPQQGRRLLRVSGGLGGGLRQRPVRWRQRHAGLLHSVWGKPRGAPASLPLCAAAQQRAAVGCSGGGHADTPLCAPPCLCPVTRTPWEEAMGLRALLTPSLTGGSRPRTRYPAEGKRDAPITRPCPPGCAHGNPRNPGVAVRACGGRHHRLTHQGWPCMPLGSEATLLRGAIAAARQEGWHPKGRRAPRPRHVPVDQTPQTHQ